MRFRVTITGVADLQLRSLPVREQRMIEAAVQTRLTTQPTTPTRAVKRLRPNSLVDYELRVGDLRVLYNVEGDEVVLLVVGRKSGNKLLVEGEEFHGHQDDSAEQA
jgi:mRNA-degrading endonuclease RelE of RelBE toxin-antitoxin system